MEPKTGATKSETRENAWYLREMEEEIQRLLRLAEETRGKNIQRYALQAAIEVGMKAARLEASP